VVQKNFPAIKAFEQLVEARRHRLAVGVAFAALLLAGSGNAVSGIKAATIEGACKYFDDPSLAEKIGSSLSYLDIALPNITPEEDRYLTSERAAMIELANDASAKKEPYTLSDKRGANLESRRLYHVWLVRHDLVEAQRSVEFILLDQKHAYARMEAGTAPKSYQPMDFFTNDDARKLYRALNAVDALSALQRSTSEFLLLESQRRTDKLLSEKQWISVYSRNLQFVFNLKMFMQCKLAKFAPMEDQF
jgi:hypothetical protein